MAPQGIISVPFPFDSLFFLFLFPEKMADRLQRREEEHPRPDPPHDLTYPRPLLGHVAMNRTVLARRFPLTKTTTVQTTLGVVHQLTIFIRPFLKPQLIADIQANHEADRFLLSHDSRSQRHILKRPENSDRQ